MLSPALLGTWRKQRGREVTAADAPFTPSARTLMVADRGSMLADGGYSPAMPGRLPHERFTGLTYESFRRMALDPDLSTHELSGFPDDYREGAEVEIVHDVEGKLIALRGSGA